MSAITAAGPAPTGDRRADAAPLRGGCASDLELARGRARARAHLDAGVEEVEHALKTEYERKPFRREGQEYGHWVLLDYGDLIVHVFDQEKGVWFAWKDGAWKQEDSPRITTRRFTGTGSRDLSDRGEEAIRQLFTRSFGAKP